MYTYIFIYIYLSIPLRQQSCAKLTLLIAVIDYS